MGVVSHGAKINLPKHYSYHTKRLFLLSILRIKTGDFIAKDGIAHDFSDCCADAPLRRQRTIGTQFLHSMLFSFVTDALVSTNCFVLLRPAACGLLGIIKRGIT